MKRKIYDELIAWKNLKSDKMPLVLYGARQIGKTWVLQEFGKNNYKNTVYVNFERESNLLPYFEDNISPKNIINILEEYYNEKIIPKETLIIFDEIQTCNRALTSLKYFAEDAKEYDVVAAGSLLGVHINSINFSFPVGKVITKTMYPMDFKEFLWALNKNILLQKIEESFNNNIPLEDGFHKEALELYDRYMLVGGMPLSVECYVKSLEGNQGLNYGEIQRIIIETYTSDMVKYSDKSQGIKTISTYESIAPQLAKDNKKFKYSAIEKGARASIFGDSIDWLIRSGIILKCDKTTRGDVPPNIYSDVSSFKLYMNDIGLLSYKIGLNTMNRDNLNNIFMGGVIENYIATSLKSNNYSLYYWKSDGKAEVDYLIQKNGDIIPIEVKTSEHNKSKSLYIYMKKYSPKYAIRISKRNFGFENNIKSVPLYAAYLI